MPRSIKTYSLDVDVTNALEKRCKETGEKMSRVVEQGLRLALALPPAPKEEGESELGDTRSMQAVRETLKRFGPGPWKTYEINAAINGERSAVGVTLKALHALARRDEVHLWGASERWSDGDGYTVSWDLQTPLERVGELIDAWKARGGAPFVAGGKFTGLKLIQHVRKLVECVDDNGPVIALMGEATGFDAEALNFVNVRQMTAQREADYAAKYPNGPV